MSWLQRLLPARIRTVTAQKKGVPEGVWVKCEQCNDLLYRAELEKNLFVCFKCNHHHRLSARQRLDQFLDEQDRVEIAASLEPIDRLKFRDTKKYKDRIAIAQKTTGEREALVVMQGKLKTFPVVVAAFEFKFMGGSMGAVVGEKFVRGVSLAQTLRCPFICFSASGGARMQEGLFSLMQMAKTSAVLARFSAAGLPYIMVLTDPTMGGVSASFGTLGDIIIAEPNALIGFAGPRVIEQTVRQVLPEGFQRSEFLLDHGHIDMILQRSALRVHVAEIIAKLMHHDLPKDSHD